jgi:hypothetical protein
MPLLIVLSIAAVFALVHSIMTVAVTLAMDLHRIVMHAAVATYVINPRAADVTRQMIVYVHTVARAHQVVPAVAMTLQLIHAYQTRALRMERANEAFALGLLIISGIAGIHTPVLLVPIRFTLNTLRWALPVELTAATQTVPT